MKEINKNYFPVYEWTLPSAAIMGGFSLDFEKFDYQLEYLHYLEKLSEHIRVMYFANSECKEFIQGKIDCVNIDFVNYQLDSIWIRDYAPIWLQCSESLKFKLVNFPYGANHFGKSEKDDNFSLILAKEINLSLELDFPKKEIPFYFDGGNIFVDEEKNCFTSIRKDDPPLEYREKLLSNINCEKVIAMNAIPGEPTGHVDTFMKILPEKKALLAKYENPTFDKEMSKNKNILHELGYEVIEITHGNKEEHANWSYINSLIVNNKAFVPQYDIDRDDAALRVYESMGFSVIPIKARTIMKEKGSVHCITNFIY